MKMILEYTASEAAKLGAKNSEDGQIEIDDISRVALFIERKKAMSTIKGDKSNMLVISNIPVAWQSTQLEVNEYRVVEAIYNWVLDRGV